MFKLNKKRLKKLFSKYFIFVLEFENKLFSYLEEKYLEQKTVTANKENEIGIISASLIGYIIGLLRI